MDATLLRNLGVNEAIIQALQKSYGEDPELEIMQESYDLRLLLRRTDLRHSPPHVLTLPGFFRRDTASKRIEPVSSLPTERYSCNDALEFLSKSSAVRENLRINGIEIRLSDSLFNLLYYFARNAVRTKTGWIYIQDMKSDGVIPSDGYQSFSRLRSAVGGYLLKKNAKDFIEANGRKQYRLSVDPINIKI